MHNVKKKKIMLGGWKIMIVHQFLMPFLIEMTNNQDTDCVIMT